jgi:hypothetical protein
MTTLLPLTVLDMRNYHVKLSSKLPFPDFEVRAFAKEFRFNAASFPWIRSLEIHMRETELTLITSVALRDRDDHLSESKAELMVRFQDVMPYRGLDNVGTFLRWIQSALIAAVCHEANESIYYRRERVFDPHEWKPTLRRPFSLPPAESDLGLRELMTPDHGKATRGEVAE